MESVQGYYENTVDEIQTKADIFRDKFITDCQWIPWGSETSIPCSKEDFQFFSTPDYILCFTFRPSSVSVAKTNKATNEADLPGSGDLPVSHGKLESYGVTGMKALSVIFYLDDYGFYTTALTPLHYKSSMAKGKL